nr:zinc finger, CCHC-type, retrotransposon Gag domain protein [Tanacetum cinerariifolium]
MLCPSQQMGFSSPCLIHKKELIHHEGTALIQILQKPYSIEKVTAPVDAENWISHMEKIFDVMGCEDAFKTRLAVYKFEGNALAWWKAYKQAKGGDAWLITHHLTIEVLAIPGKMTTDDAEGVVCLPNKEIFIGLAQMGYKKPSTKLTFYKAFFSSQWKFLIHNILQSLSVKRTSWIEFSTAMASAVICLSKENVAEDVAHNAIPSPLPHDIPSPSQEPSSPPQQPQSSPQAPPQENDNAAQKLVIIKLKARVKRLEKANLVKSSKLRRLRKVEASKQVESSDDMEDVFNQRRMIDDMDKDEGIELVKDAKVAKSEGRHAAAEQAEKQAEIYHIDLDHSSRVLSMQEDDLEVQEVVEVLTTTKLITEVVTATASQVSAASATIHAAKPSIPAAAPTVVAAYTRRRKGVIIRDPEEELSSRTPAETPKVKDKGKGILVETPKPMKKKDQIELDAEYARKLHEEINRDEFNKDIDWDAAMDHVNQKYNNPQYIKRYQGMKKRPQTESEARKNMMIFLRNTAGYKMDFFKGMTKRLEVVKDEDDDVFIKATPLASKVLVVDYQIVLVDNKPRYPLSRFTLEKLVNVTRLQVEEESEMSLELLRFTRQQLQEYQQG